MYRRERAAMLIATTFAGVGARGGGSVVDWAARVLDALARASPEGLVLDDGLAPALYDALTASGARALRVVAVEAPCPRTRESVAALCADDRDEARTALAAADATVRRAGALGASFVVLELGAVRALEGDWVRARDWFLRGELDEDDALGAMAAREAAGERALDGARRALERLTRTAEAAGVTLCVRGPRRYVELPTAREMDRLAAELRGAPVAPLFDVTHAHLQDAMGFQPLALALAAFAASAPLVYVGDACGAVGALAPGRGVVDLRAVDAAVPKTAVRAFRPWSGLTVDETVESFAAFQRNP
jgi:hypothetical protein